MSNSLSVAQGGTDLQTKPQPANPLKNPSYPQRVHIHERPHWEGVLRTCEQRIATAKQKLDVIGAGPNREAFNRLYSQMLGARDQVADAVRRLPMETGDLYEEDKHKLEEAVKSLDRVFKRWETQPTV